MIKMKALRSFGVRTANEGKVQRGREFSAASEQRARDLEAAGLAFRLHPVKLAQDQVDQAAPQNKAAENGPLASPGGTTGADAPVPSSPPDRPRRTRRSKSSKTDLLS